MAKVLFVQETFFPFQSIAKLSAYLKQAGHEVDLVIGDEKKVVTHVKSTSPDLIGFSVLTPYRNHMVSVAKAIKHSGIETPIIAGGYDITFLPQILAHSGLDIVCRGEGEAPLTELCDRIDAGKNYCDIPNLWVKKGAEIYKNPMRVWAKDLNKFPFDDRDLYLDYDNYFKIIPFTQVLAGRGCPYRCSYCFNHGYSKIYRNEGSNGYCNLRSVEHVIEELLMLKHQYKARFIFFNDSTLTYNKKWLIHFLKEYKEKINLPFTINAVITEITEKVGKAIHDNGQCKLIRFGLETGNEEFRMAVLNKPISNNAYFKGTDILKRYNLRYSMSMMLGLPGETMNLSWETLKTAKHLSNRNSVHAVNIFKPFPGLDITEYGIKIGQYNKADIASHELPDTVKKAATVDSPEGQNIETMAMGTRDLCYYENYRTDEEGKQILRLSRFSHLAIRFPTLRPFIRILIKFPDNILYRFIWLVTESMLNIRVHGHVPFSFFIKYYMFHAGKKIR